MCVIETLTPMPVGMEMHPLQSTHDGAACLGVAKLSAASSCQYKKDIALTSYISCCSISIAFVWTWASACRIDAELVAVPSRL